MEIKREDVPYNYIHCTATKQQCKRAEQCLRALAMKLERRENDGEIIEIVDPRYMETRTETQPCQWFVEAKLKEIKTNARRDAILLSVSIILL